ncbi:PREDICTED: alpha-latrotoxin-Lh1a-like, partial [Rhagoletis zephyria]|uniref:alpha-latrotoxin-Lh1a-like n=1 Tax=Rhagoletis zephyria TaxID=28612 RepID=UPI0008116ED3
MSNRCKPPEPSISLIIYNVGMAIAKAVGGFFPKLNAIVNVVEQGKNIYDTIKNGGKEGPDPILLDCMNRNFENIKANAQSIAQNAKLIDRNYQAVLQISRELQNAKNEILKSVEESTIKPILSDLKTFLSDFTTKSKELSLLNDDELITRLENPDGFMYFIKELIKSGKSGNFHARLNDIINLDLAIPENDKDSFKFIMLFLLVNSLSSYVSMLETLNAQYGKLIEQHFDHSEIKEYNKLLKFRYDMFKDIGTGLIASNTGLIDKVIAVLEKVASVPDFADKKDLLTELSVAQENFKKLKVVIANKIKSQFVEVPKRITVNPDFSKSKIKTPAKPSWIAKRKVSYAILYEDENTKKRTVVSRWSNPYRIGSKACPTVKIPLDPQRRTRIIYRKFHPDDDPKLVAIITAPNATSFVDIDRDVFNIAKETSEDAVEEIEPYVRHGANINAVFEKARTSLHVAAASGILDLVRYLVEHGARADQFDRNGYTALHNAAWKGAVDFVEGAIAEGLMDANVLSYQSNTPLHSAVLGEHALVVDALLSFPQTDVTLKNYHGLSALHLAAVRGYEAIVELFLSTEFGAAQNAIINQPSDSGWTALHLAVANGRTTVVERLLEKKDRQGKSLLVNVAGQGGNTALHLAVQRKDPVLVRLLLSSGADVAAQTAAEHQTALHYAVAHYEPAVLRALLEAGAPVNQPDTLGQTVTPLYYALQHGLTDVVRLLLASCAKFDLLLVGGRTQLHLAAVKGDVAVLRGLIEQGADVNQKFYLHVEGEKVERQALDLALENGNVEVAEILIQNNAEVKFLFDWKNSQMDSINKPLSRLHLNEDQSFQMVEMLKKAKKDYQATFTLFACRKGFLRLLNSLKDNDFDKRVISCAKNAIKFGQIEIIKNLKKIRSVKYKWSLNENDLELEFLNLFSLIKEPYVYFIKNNFDLSEKKLAELLHLAAKEGHYEMLKCTIDLLQEHFEKEHEIYSNKNFLVRQSMAGYLDALNNDGKSSLLLACEYNADTKIVEYLLNAGAKINLTESSGSSELYYAAKHGNLPSVKLLVANGAVVDQIHKNGYTPLATAIEGKGSFELVKYLEENGANLYLKVKTDTNEEITLANLALKADKIDVAEYLVKKKVQIIKAGFSHAEWTKLQE